VNTKAITGSRHLDGWDNLQDYVQTLAMRNGKSVKLVISGLQDIELESGHQQKLKEICIQLLRNAVVHGIESPRDRELSEKSVEGRIDLRLAKLSEREMELTIMDDGQGLDYAAIREKAMASGRWSSDEIETWDNKRLLALIFNEGFSTAKEVSKDAGRGVGLDAVMSHILAQRGKISVSSRRGHYCRFVITLPLVSLQETKAA
jgi:chemotaxis protein histidine kinase CheA